MSATVVVISGTGTGVGKTWLGVKLIGALRQRGLPVAARKPVQSFDPAAGSTDADLLSLAGGEPLAAVCPAHRSYPVPLAPPIAAKALSRAAFSLADIVQEVHLPQQGIVLVEGVGGPRSPLAFDGDTVRLAHALHTDLVVLVANAGLGAINAVMLSAAAFGNLPLIVFLNRFDAGRLVHQTNCDWLKGRQQMDVITDLDLLTQRLAQLPKTAAGRNL